MASGIDIDPIALEREIGKRSLYEFVKMSWLIVKPGEKFIENWHFKEICRHLEACYRKEITNLVINIPPGHGKTLISNVFFPAWVWIHKPNAAFLYASYNKEVLTKPSVEFGNLVAGDWYQRRWGDVVKPDSDNWSKFTQLNDQGGTRWAESIRGGITGKHVDFLFVDDPIRPKDASGNTADVKKELQTISDIFNNTIPSRVATKRGAIVVIMQRLNEKDISAVAVRSGLYELLCLPASYIPGLYKKNKLGVYDPRTEEGEILWPELFSKEKLENIRLYQLGSFDYAAQYQQSPVPGEGGTFKREWIQYYKELPQDPSSTFIQSWDTTLSDSSTSDYVVGQVWMKLKGSFYLIDQIRARMSFPETLQAIKNMSSKWPKATRKYIEEAASGKPIIQVLKKDISGIIGVKINNTDKPSRVNSISGLWEAGNVYIPDPTRNPWIHDFVEELATFPRGRNDDQVDAMSQALLQLHNRSISQISENLKSWLRR